MRQYDSVRAWHIFGCFLLAAAPVAASRIPGGPQSAKALAADCYGEIEVVDVTAIDVSLDKHGVPTIGCMDGTACDQGAAYDDSCVFRVALCANQSNVDGCTPPTSLQSFRATGKVKGLKGSQGRIAFAGGPLTEGCGPFLDIVIPVKDGKGGRGARRAILKLSAKAPRGVTPRTDRDTIVLSCEPIPPGVCVDSAKCDDGNLCTADVCTDGVCSNPVNVDCSTPPDACSFAGDCDPATGQCIYPPAAAETICGDCKACDGAGTCVDNLPVCEPGGCGLRTIEGCSVGTACFCSECSTCVGGTCQPESTGTPCSNGVCIEGACVTQCEGDDGSTCSDNKCETYLCEQGRCVFQGPVVCPLPSDVPDCYGPSFCNADTGSCDRTYEGDNTVCGAATTTGNGSICCGGECVPSNEENCGVCGNACVDDPACVKGSCTCTASFLTDNANCGTCGNACVNSICFQGECLDGCVIDGHFYLDGEPDLANECQICKTAASRTSWTALHTDLGNIHFCNAGGCRQSQCYKGRCGCGTDPTCAILVPENSTGGCVSTPCADVACVNNACVYTPKNENQECDTAFDPRARVTRGYGSSNCVGQFGTCESGICDAGAANDGGFCLVEDYADAEVCQEPFGTCFGGECTSPRWTCYPLPDYCPQRNPICSPNPGCAPQSPPELCNPVVTCVAEAPPPLSGTISCGNPFDPEREKCCDGQVCVCPPTAGTTCFALECWSPEDLDNL
jgi:hypothetical protein